MGRKRRSFTSVAVKKTKGGFQAVQTTRSVFTSGKKVKTKFKVFKRKREAKKEQKLIRGLLGR